MKPRSSSPNASEDLFGSITGEDLINSLPTVDQSRSGPLDPIASSGLQPNLPQAELLEPRLTSSSRRNNFRLQARNLSPSYPLSRFHGSFGHSQDFKSKQISSSHDNLWRNARGDPNDSQEDADKDLSVNGNTKPPSPDSSSPYSRSGRGRRGDGAMHVYSTQPPSHTAYVPLPMNIPSNAFTQPSLTSYGAKHPNPHYPMPATMGHSYSTSSMMNHASAGFSSSLPTSISAPIPIRRHTPPHIAYPEYGRDESYEQASSQSYDGSIQSPDSVQSPNERSFSDSEYEVPSYAAPVMSTPFRGATAVIESGSPYNVHHSRGHAQEGSDGSNSGWRTMAANVIDWSGRAHGGHSRDSSSGSTASNTTAIGEQQHTSIPYSVASNHDHDYYERPHIRSFNQTSPPAAYYEAAQSPNYVPPSSYPLSQPHGFGSPQSISPVALIGSQQIVPKTESFEPELTPSSYNNLWQQPRGDLNSSQEDDDKDSGVDDDTKSPSPDSSLPNTPAAVELALPPVVPSQPFTNDSARITSISPPPHVDFDIHITSSGNIRMPSSSRTVPVPIPNLTKKSRGRRIPTKPATAPATGVGKSARTFTCTVDGCGKCFNRGEHLKRHIRSIHTDEKPHVCPVQKCGKTFSRHDNLCQHMRVHGKFSAPADGGVSDH